jgi:hypothetical protein
MKQKTCAAIAAFFAAAFISMAGDLTVEGDLNVTSNLAARTLSATNAALGALRVDGPAVFTGTLQGDGSAVTNLSGANLVGGSVGAGSLAPGAVTSAKIQAGSITDAHVAADAAISQSKVAGLADAVVSLNAHLAAADNPHGVTAAQIGALTNETDALALAAFARYATTNQVTRWRDSADPNIWWEVANGTTLTAYRILVTTNSFDVQVPYTGNEDILLDSWGNGYDVSFWFRPSEANYAFGLLAANGVDVTGDPFLYNGNPHLPPDQAAFTFAWYWPEAENPVLASHGLSQEKITQWALASQEYIYFTPQGMGDYLSVSATGLNDSVWYISGGWVHSNTVSTTTNIVASYNLASITGDVWQAVASAYPSSNPSNYVGASAVDGMIATATANLLPVAGDGSQLTGITAAQVGAYTVNQADAAIAAALAGFEPGAGVRTNHVGDVTVSGSVAAAAFTGDGFGVTNLNLVAYAGDNLSWTGGRLHAAAGGAGYTDAQAVAAVTAADLDMAAHRVTGLADALAGTDAVNLRSATNLVQDAVQQALLNVGPFGDLSMGAFTQR